MAESKTYWLINQYASTPGTGMGGRHYYLAKELAKQGNTVFLIAAGYTHLLRTPPVLDNNYMIEPVTDGFNFVWVGMSKYSDAHDKKRILNWFIFAWKLLKLPQIIENKPDAILYSSPSLVAFLGAQRLAKKLKSKLAFEVRDIWPLTLTELGGYSPKHPFIRFMQWVEDKAYHDSDVIFSNLPNAVEHMVTRGMAREKFQLIPNGFDLSELKNPEPLAVTTQLALPKGKFIIGYTGTLGVANALDSFIEAARLLKDEVEIAFVLVGGGKEKSTLVEQAEGLNNVYFVDPIPKQQIQSMLAEFDVCYIGWKREPIYRFGIAPNKVPEYMLAGKPIIHAYSGAYDSVEMAKAGLSVPAEDPQAVADAIVKLKGMLYQDCQQMGQNGRDYALEHHDYSKLSLKLAEVLSLN
jgi:glycosyltransferase involved in cell wall biosynthesis